MPGERPTGAATDSVELFVPPLPSTTFEGLNEPSSGRKKAERIMLPANPFKLVRFTENVVVDPTGRVAFVGLDETLKSGEARRGRGWELSV